MLGATFPRLDFTTRFAGGTAQVKAIGQFSELDPAVVTGNERVKGRLTGAVDLDTTIRAYADGVTVDTLDVAGRINLGRSEVAGLLIDTAAVDGSYTARTGQLTQFSVDGPDLHAAGQGTIALNETGGRYRRRHGDGQRARAQGRRHAAGEQHRLRRQ
jgi:hypothetical protein